MVLTKWGFFCFEGTPGKEVGLGSPPNKQSNSSVD